MTPVPVPTPKLPVMYVLMRTDMASMNAGKACAQAHHASSCFHKMLADFGETVTLTTKEDELQKAIDAWCQETPQGFGTVLTLEVDERQMRKAVAAACAAGYLSKIIHDPTYPVKDGKIVHKIPMDTCAFVFGYKEDIELLLDNLGLLRDSPPAAG